METVQPRPHYPNQHLRRLRLLGPCLLGLALSSMVSSGGCLYDADDRCGEGQQYLGNQCVCDDGYGLIRGKCQKCGEHEYGNMVDGCLCDDGFERADDSEPCVEVGIGHECTTDDDCGKDAPSCHVEEGEGYCTTLNCKKTSDCTGSGYYCNYDEAISFCERPPTGLNETCVTSADCLREADYCEVATRHTCLVSHCKPDPTICHGDWVCCDIQLLDNSICVPQDALTLGQCPAGGVIIPRNGGVN